MRYSKQSLFVICRRRCCCCRRKLFTFSSLTNLTQNWVKKIKICSNEGPDLLQKRDNLEFFFPNPKWSEKRKLVWWHKKTLVMNGILIKQKRDMSLVYIKK